MAATAQEKVIRVRVDSTQAVKSVNDLHAAFNHLAQSNPAVAALTNQLKSVQNAANGAGGNAGVGAVTSRFGALGSAAQGAMQHLSSLNGTMSGVATSGMAIGITAGVGALVALGTAAVNASAKMEAYRASLTTVLGSSDKASQAFDKLVQFAAKTPFSLDQSVEGFIKLKALGLQPSERAMMSYGNTASAMGRDLNSMVEAVADAATGEFERLKGFGIKASKQGNDIAFTFQGVTTKVKNNATDIQSYLMGIGEVNFGGAMARQMDTFNGAMSNLEDTVQQSLAKIGDGGLTKTIAKIINGLSSGLTAITPLLTSIFNAVSGIIEGVGAVINGVGSMFSSIFSGGANSISFLESLTFTFNMIGQAAQVVGNVIGAVFGVVGNVVGGVVGWIGDKFQALFAWLGLSSSKTTTDISNTFIGILRAVKYLSTQMPQMFSIALGSIGGMFSIIGQRLKAFFSGDFSAFNGMGAAIANNFRAANAQLGAIQSRAMAIVRDTKGNNEALDRMLGRSKTGGGASLADLAGAAPRPTAQAGSGKGDKDAEKRAKAESDFWQTLQNELATAQLFGIEAQKLTKEKELQKALERDLTSAERSRVDTMVQDIANAKAVTSLKQASFDLSNQNLLLQQRSLGLTEDQAKIEDAIQAKRLEALNSGADINSAAYVAEVARYRMILEQNQALDKQRQLLTSALETARGFASAYGASFDAKRLDDQKTAFLNAFNAGDLRDAWGAPLTDATAAAISAGFDRGIAEAQMKPLMDALTSAAEGSITAAARLAGLKATQARDMQLDGLAGSGLSTEAQARAQREIMATWRDGMTRANSMIGEDFTDKLTSGIDDIADRFGGVFGRILKGFGDLARRIQADASGTSGTAKLFTLISDKLGSGFSEAAQQMKLTPENMRAGFDKLGSPLKDLKESFSGPNGSFMKGIGKAVGGAMQGYAIGEQVGSLMSSIGIKHGETGAKIGGTIGGLTGNPIIAAGASAIGGLIGSLFYKPKFGTASLTGADPASITGNKGSIKTAASGAAGSVQSGLADIAAKLGGTVGAFSVAIGQWDGKWRVNDNATDKALHSKNFSSATLHNFDGDEAAAVAYAIKNAISDGAIKGISAWLSNALSQAGEDAAVALYQSYKSAMDDLDSMVDPIGASVRNIVNPINSLIDQMKQYGATVEETSKLEDLRTRKLADALKSQLSSLNGFLSALKGEGSGVTALDRLTADMAKFDDYKSRIASGDSSVDQDAFTSLGQEIFGLAKDVYGTATSEFQNIRTMLTGTSEQLANNVTGAFNAASPQPTITAIDNTTAAINSQTSAQMGELVTMNARLQMLIDQGLLNANAAVSGYDNGAAGLNGRYLGVAY